MQSYRFSLRPLSAFGTPLAGDTLFGQLCWALRHQLGNARLNELLLGYTAGHPFAVVSDALPAGHLPLPSVTSDLWQAASPMGPADRKALKKRKWLQQADLALPFAQWQSVARTDAQVTSKGELPIERAQSHNTINRHTGTTGEGPFAPFVSSQIWFQPGMQFDMHVVLDEARISLAELGDALAYIGYAGFGRDASVGLGKFELLGEATVASQITPTNPNVNCYLTLGPSAPQGQGFCPVRSTYQVVTRFGRHGDAAVQSGQPFKRPVLLARAGGVFWPEAMDARLFIGQGLGGRDNPVSTAMPETVHQGYTPVIPIALSAEVSA